MFEGCVVRCVSRNTHAKRVCVCVCVCVKEIGLCVQNLLAILRSIFYTIGKDLFHFDSE